ncbi:hypothetical protein AA0Y32_14955 [Georgenia phoenicis]|uniref:hypothetical protein n=1 Tax=unclassified Georgenia TaxID=2626815 RepID=UPI0039B0C543
MPLPEAELTAAARAAYARRRDIKLRLAHTPNTDTLALLTTYRRTNPDLGRMRLRTVLNALAGLGQASTSRLLTDLNLNGDRRLNQLGPRQARTLAERLNTANRHR